MSLFKQSYWKSAISNTKNIRMLSLCALLIALQIAIASFYIPVAENLRIYGTFFIVSLYSAIAGPIMALSCAFIADTLGFILHPQGAYFFGYTVSAMLGSLIYALFLYRQKITLFKLFLSKLLVNIFINAVLGSLWTSMLFSKGFYFYFSLSITKNLILLPLEVVLLYFVFKTINPYLYKKGYTTSAKISFF